MSYYNNNNEYNSNSNNDYYNNHPNQYQNSYPNYTENVQPPTDPNTTNTQGDRGLLGAAGGLISGSILGKQTNHTFLGGAGGAIIGSLAEDFLKKRSRPSSPQPPTAVAVATATAVANTNGGYGTTQGHTPIASPMSPPAGCYSGVVPAYGTSSTSTTTMATTGYFQPPCVGTANPCQGVHHCGGHDNGSGHGYGGHHHHVGGASWNTWHK